MLTNQSYEKMFLNNALLCILCHYGYLIFTSICYLILNRPNLTILYVEKNETKALSYETFKIH